MLFEQKFNVDLEICKKLCYKFEDLVGVGCEKNVRYLDGKLILIKNVIIWVGELVKGISVEDVCVGKGWKWIKGDVLLQYGFIQKVEVGIFVERVLDDVVIYEVYGRFFIVGIIDMYFYVGVYFLLIFDGSLDGNEMFDNIIFWVCFIDVIFFFDV